MCTRTSTTHTHVHTQHTQHTRRACTCIHTRAHASSAVTLPEGRTELCGASSLRAGRRTASHPSHPQPAAATARPLNPAGPCPPPVDGGCQLLPRCGVWASFLLIPAVSAGRLSREPQSQARPASSGQPASRGWTPGRLPTSLPGPWAPAILAVPSQTRASASGVLRYFRTPGPRSATQPQA